MSHNLQTGVKNAVSLVKVFASVASIILAPTLFGAAVVERRLSATVSRQAAVVENGEIQSALGSTYQVTTENFGDDQRVVTAILETRGKGLFSCLEPGIVARRYSRLMP